MAQSGRRRLKGLYEKFLKLWTSLMFQFLKLWTGEQLPPNGGSEKKDKLEIDCLPAEVLAICLSYTGKDLSKARLACRRFNEIIEEYQYMMNVIPVYKMIIRKDEQQDFLAIEVMRFYKTTCKLDELMKYVRFLRPKKLSIDCEKIVDIKEYLTGTWRKSIVDLELCGKESHLLLSNFPNVRELSCVFGQSVVASPPALAQISSHPSPFRSLELSLNSFSFDYCEKNDALLEVLSVQSNKFSSGMEDVDVNLACSMEAIFRFIENAKFAKNFSLIIKCHMKCISSNSNLYTEDCCCLESCRYHQLNNWLSAKGLVRSSSNPNEPFKFVYRSTEFWVNLY